MKLVPIALLTLAATAAVSCGQQEKYDNPTAVENKETEVERLKEQILFLQGTVTQINSLVLSDWADCSTGGPDTLSTLQQNMCRIAQAATVEARLKMKGELAVLAQSLQNELDDLQSKVEAAASATDVDQLKTDLYGNSTGATCAAPVAGSVCARINSAESRLNALEATVNNPTTGVAALNTAITNINAQLTAVINGAMIEITVGEENLSAGPLYEAVLVNPTRSRITAYIESLDANIVVPNNGCSATNGSPNITITANNSFVAGNVVKLNGFTSCRGISAAVMNESVVVSSANATSFSFVAAVNATSTGSGGGSMAYIQRVNGRGLGRAWQALDGEQLLTTTLSNKPYKFLVTGGSTTFIANPDTPLPLNWSGLTPGQGFICWSKTDRNASAATIKAGGSAIRCK